MRRLLRSAVLTLLLGFLVPSPLARATWYYENVESGADIVMMDLRWPWWPSGTYYANWNVTFNPEPSRISFYAGLTSFVGDGPNSTPNPDAALQASFRPGNVWTFWGSDAAGTPVRFTDVAPNLFIKNQYGGEGSSGTVGSEVWPFIERQRWYTMLARVWRPVEGDDTAYVGRWIKDVENGRWHVIGVARLPVPASSFRGNSGFIEPLTGEKVVRPLQRRLGYFRKETRWQKADTITIDKSQYVVVNTLPEGQHEYVAIEYAQHPALLPIELSGEPLANDRKHHFTVRQPDQPTLDRPEVQDVRALLGNGQIAVSWEVPETASPAFGYTIEVFDNPQCAGEPKVIQRERMPTVRQALVSCDLATPTVRLTLTDVFDQEAPSVVATNVQAPAPHRARDVDHPVMPGLAYELFHKNSKRRVNYFNPPLQKPNEEHYWLTLNELVDGQLVRRGIARGFDVGVRESRHYGYALTFEGFLRVPASGLYLFRAQIDGAYRMEIGGDVALEWDGQHGTTAKTAVVPLARGDHPLRVTYLYDHLATRNFGIEWEGPNLPRQAIPLDALMVADDGQYPSVSIVAEAGNDGTGRVRVDVDARGHQVESTSLFLGNLRLVESKGGGVEYAGPLPQGVNSLWARAVYDEKYSVDSQPATLGVHGAPVTDGWTVHNVSDANVQAGVWQTGPRAFQFFGAGMHVVSQKVTGDFTATCHVDAYAGAKGEPVNPRAWVGVVALERADRLDWRWGEFFYLVQTAREGLRVSADFSDLGAGRISSYALPSDRPWLRIARHGNIWTAWSSKDGEQWELSGYQFKKAPPTMEVGLFFSALPQNSLAHYNASVSDLCITPGVADVSVPLPPIATKTSGDRITGVVMARSNPDVVVVRSTSEGLLRSTDGGESWTPANGALRGDDLAVRSVAIHPENPEVMLRAGGRGGSGGLWKTSDGGQTWSRLEFEGDFDGAGPSALCGEVVAFDLRSFETVYVGCESRGLFKSTDGGAHWESLGLVGERVTAVTVWPWEKHYPAAGKGRTHLCVTTCPDRWMTYLGRGTPRIVTEADTSRSYVSSDGVKTITLADERSDTGFFNVAFDKATQSTGSMSYATSHGYQAQVSAGRHMALYPEQKNLESMRPFTALGAAAKGDEKFGRFMTQALDPVRPERLSVSERWAESWSWLSPQGDVPKGGLIAVAGDVAFGKRWWLVSTDGVFRSPDGGITLQQVLDQAGKPLVRHGGSN